VLCHRQARQELGTLGAFLLRPAALGALLVRPAVLAGCLRLSVPAPRAGLVGRRLEQRRRQLAAAAAACCWL
jgi:hypothetical protein